MRYPSLQWERWPAPFWIGLGWVYSGAFWLFGLLAAAQAGWPGGALALGLRLAGTLALGVGLCATERWAWAPAVCLTRLYGVLGVGIALAAGWTSLAARAADASGPLPALWGLPGPACGRLAFLALAVAAVGFAVSELLWRARALFDVPRQRAFTCLVRQGLLPAGLLLLADLYLLAGIWSVWTRR